MTQNKEQQVAIQFKESTWKDILDLLYHACQLRGYDWIPWQREIAEIVSAALQAALPPGEPYRGRTQMTRKKELEASIQLEETTWKDIVDLMYHACQMRGADWIPWQLGIAEIVSAALEADLPPGEPYIGDEVAWLYSDWWAEQGICTWGNYADILGDAIRDDEAALRDWH